MSLGLTGRSGFAHEYLTAPGSTVEDARIIPNEEGYIPEPKYYDVAERTDKEISDGMQFASSAALGDRTEKLGVNRPSISRAKIIRLKDLGAQCKEYQALMALDMEERMARLVGQFVHSGTPGVLTIVHDQSHELDTLAPILEPEHLRAITNQLIADALASMGAEDSMVNRLLGTTAILHQRLEGSNGLQKFLPSLKEGVLDMTSTSLGRRRNFQDQSDVVMVDQGGKVSAIRAGKLPKAVLAQAARYPMLDAEEANDEAIVIALDGSNISPAAISSIAREMGIEGPMGMIVAAKGNVNLSAIHSLPTGPIDRIDMGRLMLRHSVGQMLGAGTVSHSEPYSRHGHVHAEGGHFLDATGKVWALVYPAKQESIIEYA